MVATAVNRRVLDSIVAVIAALVLWHGLFVLSGPDAVASPLQTLERLAALMQDSRFWTHASATMLAFAYACLISIAIGLPLGVAIGAHRVTRDVAEPILGTLYSIPKITLYPVILLIFGLGVSAKVAFGALHGVFPVVLFAIGAIRNLSPSLVRTARILQLSPGQTAVSVLAPAALPEILTGLRIGVSAALLGTIIGELFASNQGLGFMLIRAMEVHNVADIFAVTLFLFVVAGAANSLLLMIERRWQWK
jgi:NitT/TauT family transport system permease protein